ncbi:MAG: flagellar hook-basal body complex protein FliE [Candidatus Eremiobacterota bacterium]
MQNPYGPVSGIGGIGGIKPLEGLSGAPAARPTEENANSFSALLGNALGTVNSVMDHSKVMTEKLATGDMNGIHEMTIAGAKAEVAMKLTTTIASKLASATTQLFQMQL